MKIREGFAKRKIGGRYIVVATGDLSKEMNIIIEMNDTSSDIWDLIAQGKTIDEIAQALSEKYAISVEKAKADTEKLIEQMAAAGVFEK
ncbi:MAG: PqqD family protein [Eubacterium sp.]|jgi:ABC-type sugar transport system substrate-binding protein|nr:PqqD family protein [Eubacterium sp.]